MKVPMLSYTQNILESVSFDTELFCKELEKAFKALLPYEIDKLMDWVLIYTETKPELKQCLVRIKI